MKHIKNKAAFTLVELIVVVTILAILATIGFVSYSSYLTGVRDTNRLSQLVSIHDGLELYSTRKDLPLPDDNIEIQANGETIALQGTAGVNTLETIDFTKGGKDPKDGNYFAYYLTKDRKEFQLMSFLEEEVDFAFLSNNVFAADYSNRIPATYGSKLGIIVDADNIPVNESNTYVTAGILDFEGTDSGDIFSVYLESGRSYTFNGGILNHKMYSLSKPSIYGFKKGCPDGFVGVPGDSAFDQRGFCVAQYEMSFVGLTTRDVSERNAIDYRNFPSTNIQSKRGGLPISMITQLQAINACSAMGKGYHLITNNQWMTIARNIEFEKENWTGQNAGEGYLPTGNSNSANYGCQDQTPSGNNGATTGATTNASCNEMRKQKLSNSAYVWDMSGNLREHVNKANTIDGTDYNLGSNTSIASGGSGKVYWDSSFVSSLEKGDYGPLILVSTSIADHKGGGYVAPSTGNIFIRGGSATSGNDSGLYDLLLDQSETSYSTNHAFRCAYQ